MFFCSLFSFSGSPNGPLGLGATPGILLTRLGAATIFLTPVLTPVMTCLGAAAATVFTPDATLSLTFSVNVFFLVNGFILLNNPFTFSPILISLLKKSIKPPPFCFSSKILSTSLFQCLGHKYII